MDVEFKLFGSLTVRQFVSLAGGITFAAIIYFLKLPIVLSFPLILFSVLLGFGVAFMTVNGQPFARWFKNFVVAMFSSQKYVWRKSPQTPKGLDYSAGKVTRKKPDKEINKELGVSPIAEVVSRRNVELDEGEKSDLARIDKYFDAEYSKYNLNTLGKISSDVQLNQSRVDPVKMNLANDINPIGRGQRQVQVGDGKKVIYDPMQNRQQRPIAARQTEDQSDLIEAKIKEILLKQRQLDPYIKTMELEEQEKKLREDMRRLYQEVQNLKNNSNG